MAKKALVNKAAGKRGLPCAPTPVQQVRPPRTVYRKFGLCRILPAKMAHAGELHPACQKSSW